MGQLHALNDKFDIAFIRRQVQKNHRQWVNMATLLIDNPVTVGKTVEYVGVIFHNAP
jgi:hypothetical protein